MPTEKKIDYKIIGKALAVLLDLINTVRKCFENLKIGAEVFEWLNEGGKGTLGRAINLVAQSYKRCRMLESLILSTENIHHHEENGAMDGLDFCRRSKQETGGRADDLAFEFYCRPENHKLLPSANSGDVIAFPDTSHYKADALVMHSLQFDGVQWNATYVWMRDDEDVRDNVRVAKPAL